MNRDTSNRLGYMDIAKAIMMTCLMFGHCALGLKTEALSADVWHDYFLVFYMQGFFFVTGYCSNFDKPFFQFLKSNIKTLIIPAILFTIICRGVIGMINTDTIELFIERMFNGIGYWFLWAMFFAKLLYWGIHRLRNDYLKIVLMLTIFSEAGLFSLQFKSISDPLFIRNAMLCSVFLCFGEYIRKFQMLNKKRLLLSISSFFVFLITLLILFNLSRPSVTAAIILGSRKDIPLHLILATTGSISCIYISQLIGQNRLLQLIGRNTLCIYGFHVFILDILLCLVKTVKCLDFADTSTANVAYVVISILTLAISLGLSILANRYKFFCLLTGKW